MFKSSIESKPKVNSILSKNLDCKFASCLLFVEYQESHKSFIRFYSRIDFDYNP